MYTRPGTGGGFNDGSSYASSSHYSGLPPGHGGLPHGLPVTLSAHSSISGANRVVDALASGTVKEQRLKSARGQDIAIFVEMDDGGGDVFLSGRVSPRLPASGARVTFRLSLTEEHRPTRPSGSRASRRAVLRDLSLHYHLPQPLFHPVDTGSRVVH